MKNIIIKALGLSNLSALESKVNEIDTCVAEVAEEVNNRFLDVEDLPSKFDDLDSRLSDIESAEYASEDYINDKCHELESDLSDKIEEAVSEALEGHVQTVTDDMVERAVKNIVTKEFILALLAK
jgi:SMC interacting uncharacterized protein involved in chromosome segregation